MNVLKIDNEEKWDERYWLYSQKADDPMAAWNDIQDRLNMMRSASNIAELPKEQQDWLRAK